MISCSVWWRELKGRRPDPFAEDVEMGALINRTQYQRVLGHIQRGIEAGARLLCGGERPADLRRAISFARPYSDVPLDSALWNEEIFGPVLCVRRFATEDEAIALANDSDFGLVASVVAPTPPAPNG
jgi:betaine-aldehyde dehydrogenase